MAANGGSRQDWGMEFLRAWKLNRLQAGDLKKPDFIKSRREKGCFLFFFFMRLEFFAG